ncbi:XRE family transcriptional regulator [Lachnospiraceae bacterium oral taxon 500]|nr:XRE family transcriptional regulator [Lachnospiraceae bacterium oral taxon 500]
MQLQEKIKSIRLNANLTQSEFAKELGISQGRISEIEKGNHKPSFETLQALKDKFNVSLDWLFSSDNSSSDNLIELSEFEANILKLISQLPDREKYKLEGMLEYKVAEMNEAKTEEKKYSAYTF